MSHILPYRWGHLPVEIPRLAQRLNEVRSRPRELVVNSPGTGDTACTPLDRFLQGKQRHNVAGIGVIDLHVGRVCRGAEHLVRMRRSEVFDVVQNHPGGVLRAAEVPYVCRDADICDERIELGITVYRDTAENEEPSAFEESYGFGVEFQGQSGEGERSLG